MKWRDLWKLSLLNLFSAPVRSMLTVLGIAIGAGAVLAGVIEPASAQPVRVGDDVLIGANAVVLEGVQIGDGAVVAAGAIVVRDVPPKAVVAGVPARFVKWKDEQTAAKSALVDALRNL